MKEKDPALLLYAKDWLQGTATMFPDEKGVYIDLLCHQHQDGSIPNDVDRLARLVGLSSEVFGKVWVTLKDKFVVGDDGKLRNKKLARVMDVRIETAWQNKIIATYGHKLHNSGLTDEEKVFVKKAFKVSNFVSETSETLNEALDAMFAACSAKPPAPLGDAIATGNAINNKERTNTSKSKDDLLKERKEKFGLSLQPFSEEYSREMLVKFYDYWSEVTKGGTKMRWELEKTWELKKRLARWSANQKPAFNGAAGEKNLDFGPRITNG